MAFREVSRVEILERIRRWQAGESQRQIAQHVGIARNTVSKYVEAATTVGLSADGPPPSEEQLAALLQLGDTTPTGSTTNPTERLLSAYRSRIDAWLHREHLTLTRVSELLRQNGCEVPYTSLRRFVARQGWGHAPTSTGRLAETLPGDYAEMDFGQLGYFVDSDTQRKRAIYSSGRFSIKSCLRSSPASKRLGASSGVFRIASSWIISRPPWRTRIRSPRA